MTNFRRKLAFFMAGKRKPKYTPIEYLESTGTQYINTGYIPSNKTGFKLAYNIQSVNKATTACNVFGSYSTTPNINNASFGVARLINGYNQFNRVAWGDDTNGSLINLSPDTYQVIGSRYDLFFDKADMYINETLVGTSATGTNTWQGSQPVYLFCRNNQGAANFFSNTRIYFCKCYDDNVLVRDFIPVLDENSVACMFERVEGKFYYNAGAGSFVAGPEIVFVDYLQTDGTSWIDTEYIPTTRNIIADLDLYITQSTSEADWFGTSTIKDGGDNNNAIIAGTLAYNATTNSNIFLYSRYSSAGADTNARGLASTPARHNIRLDFDGENNTKTLTIDGVVGSTGVQSYKTNPQLKGSSIFLFSAGGKNNPAYIGTRYYAAKLYDNGIFVRDMVPALINGEPCMFDVLNWEAYYNEGTGQFLYG